MDMDPIKQFNKERTERIASYANNKPLQASARGFLRESLHADYSYNFTWMGRPVFQYPQDLVALQEIIWAVQPDLIIEIGIAHGGSLVFHASMLELLGGDRFVLGIDVDIRAHNRAKIEQHPMFRRIRMIEGSSIDESIVQQAHDAAVGCRSVMICLDSNHTHDHVLAELNFYASLVSVGSYVVVFDGIVEQMPASFSADRLWGPGDNPLTAVRAFLRDHDDFVVDEEIEAKLQITAAPSGYLRRIR